MSDEPRMYGSNAWRKGTREHPDLCIASVWPRGSWADHQCTRKRGYGPGGLWCKQHGRLEEEREARRRERDLADAALDAEVEAGDAAERDATEEGQQ